MDYRTKFFIIFLLFIAVLFGYNYVVRPFSSSQDNQVTNNEIEPSPNQSDKPDIVEEKIIETLSNEEKVAQLLVVPLTIDNNEPNEDQLAWSKEQFPGFVILFGDQISSTSARSIDIDLKAAHVTKAIDTFVTVDHEGGLVQRLNGEGFTRLPSWQELCAIESKEERVELLTKSVQELSLAGVKVVYAPVLDTKAPNSPLSSRTCSQDQAIVAERAKEFITVFRANSVLPVVKHFPNIGKARRDLHTTFDSIAVSYDDLLSFRSILDTYPTLGVMTTHVGVSNQDPKIPCSLSKVCLEELKRDRPQLLVFSDSLDMASTQGQVSSGSARQSIDALALRALEAGNDVVILGENLTSEELDEILAILVAKYESDSNFRDVVDLKVKKVIEYKLDIS